MYVVVFILLNKVMLLLACY